MGEQHKARILVIDDDPFFRKLLHAHLSHAGYAVQLAEDAVEGGKALLQPDFDLVLCDISMPFMSGLELLALLRGTAETAAIPVIFASSRKDTATLSSAQDLGVCGYLIKPFTSEQLLETVSQCLTQGLR